MAKRPVKKSPAKGTVKPTKSKKINPDLSKRPPWPDCSTPKCGKPSVMQWTDHKSGEKVHGCAKHRQEYENQPYFKNIVKKFNEREAARRAKAKQAPKKRVVKKAKKK